MNASIRHALKRSRSAVIVQHLIKNLQSSRRLAEGDVTTATFAHEQDSAEAQLAYAETTLEAYREYGELSPEWLLGKHVLEIGHGDTFLVAMLLVMQGAASVTCLDRFDVRKNFDTETRAYRYLAERDGNEASKRLASALDQPDFARVLADMGIGYVYMPVEDAASLQPRSFDLILSMATLEHVSDVETSLRAMDTVLRSDGKMIHCVDLRDHGMFSDGGQHPLMFLTIPGALYDHMSKNTGAPNRSRLEAYQDCLVELGYDVRCAVSRVLGSDAQVGPISWSDFDVSDFPEARKLVAQVRRRLQRPYRDADERSLAVATFGFEARKTH